MTIYHKKTLSSEDYKRFRPTRLAIKELAGIYYFCKTIRKDIEKYVGSGTIWKNTLNCMVKRILELCGLVTGTMTRIKF